MIHVAVQTQDFSVAEAYTQVCEGKPDVGAAVFFVGLVRDRNLGDDVAQLELEHYPGMTEKSIEAFAHKAHERWPLIDIHIIHRVGKLAVQDQIVFVGVTSEHREAAFAACDFLMDYLKSQAPFWKKERLRLENGKWQERWIDQAEKDTRALQRWHNPVDESGV